MTQSKRPAGFLIAAPMSGSGKTLVSAGLMAALRARGFCVRPFKVGPDYIDPLHHLEITGRVSHNLDAWMLGKQGCRELFFRIMQSETCAPDAWAAFLSSPACPEPERRAKNADPAAPDVRPIPANDPAPEAGPEPRIAIVESAMGLFDGISGASNACSGAEMAYWLNLPIILVMDARSTARTAAAMIRGLHACDPDISLSAVIFNRVSSSNHAAMLAEAMKCMLPELPVLGFLPHEQKFGVAKRHLGLVLPGEHVCARKTELAAWIEANLDMERLLAVARACPTAPGAFPLSPRKTNAAHAGVAPGMEPKDEAMPDAAQKATNTTTETAYCSKAAFRTRIKEKVRLAVARDEAFRFFYAENLRLLEDAGAELVPFSPLRDAKLPRGAQGLYLCGGYPELFADRLSQNKSMLQSVAEFIHAGGTAYAECGGMLYLGRSLALSETAAPQTMANVLPVRFAMDTKRRGLGYRTARLLADSCLGPAGTTARGHEFHYSYALDGPAHAPLPAPLFAISNRENKDLGTTGYVFKNTAASYIHLHFGSCPGMAEYFVAYCASAQK